MYIGFMIRLKLNEMLERRGISADALHIKSGKKLHQSTISKIKNNNSKILKLETLDLLCELLDCQPADLIVYESTIQNETTIQIEEASTRFAKHTHITNTTHSASDNETLLSTDMVAERLGISRKSVNDYIIDGKLPAVKGKQNRNFVKLGDVLIFESVYIDRRADF